jgi:hypothetical protein
MNSLAHPDELGRRLLAVADSLDQPDWDDVLRRAHGTESNVVQTSRPARHRRRTMVAIVVGAALLATGAAWAASQTNALHLFRANAPAHEDPSLDALWHQTVIASSVTRAATFNIPGSGRFTFWYANTRQHGWCAAVRLPSGGWAGGPGGENVGGTTPACIPTRAQINRDQVRHGGDPVYVITGFDWDESDLTVHGTRWRMYYGVVDGRGPAVRVVDLKTGRTTTVQRGHLFAIAIPRHPYEDVRFVAYNDKGQVVADTAHPLH